MPISTIVVQETANKQLRVKFSASPNEKGVELTADEAVDVAVELLRAAVNVEKSEARFGTPGDLQRTDIEAFLSKVS